MEEPDFENQLCTFADRGATILRPAVRYNFLPTLTKQDDTFGRKNFTLQKWLNMQKKGDEVKFHLIWLVFWKSGISW